ncbi:MAG: RlmE family RNA methyltransferase [Halobacteriota archaeon]
MKKGRKDYYYKRARIEGFRSRASYKLLQIQERYHIIRAGDIVVDLGAAPGGWLQVIRSLNATAIAVDRQRIDPLEGVIFIRGDITAAETVEKIQKVAEKVDVVLSDAAPNLSGIWSLDHARSINLARSALNVAERTLKPGGNFLVKVFQGDLYDSFVQEMSFFFRFTRAFNPQASRKQSAEIYLIGKRFHRQQGNALTSAVKQ